MIYSYLEMVTEDVIQWLRENLKDNLGYFACEDEDLIFGFFPSQENAEILGDLLWDDDSVTGNGCGSYTCNRAKAKEYVIANMDEVLEAIQDLCVEDAEIGHRFIKQDWEWFDVVTRCNVLYRACEDALETFVHEEQEKLRDIIHNAIEETDVPSGDTAKKVG